MIITAYPAEYVVDVGRETHLVCGHHCGGLIHLARMARVPCDIFDLDLAHMFGCEVCEVMSSQAQPCP